MTGFATKPYQIIVHKFDSLGEGVPGNKPLVTSDKLVDSPSRLPCIPL